MLQVGAPQNNGDPSGPRPIISLCLSGGGLRSCAFTLGGVMGTHEYDRRKGEAEKVDLKQVSAVSGGGYTGSSHAVHIARQCETQDTKINVVMNEARNALIRFLCLGIAAVIVLPSFALGQWRRNRDSGTGGVLGAVQSNSGSTGAPTYVAFIDSQARVTVGLAIAIIMLSTARWLWGVGRFTWRWVHSHRGTWCTPCNRTQVVTEVTNTFKQAVPAKVRKLASTCAPLFSPKIGKREYSDTPSDDFAKLDFAAYQARMRRGIGYVITYDFDVLAVLPEDWSKALDGTRAATILQFLTRLITVPCDTIVFLVCHILAPVLLSAMSVYPAAVTLAIIILQYPGPVTGGVVWTRYNVTEGECFSLVALGQHWVHKSGNIQGPTVHGNITKTASATPVIFSIPFLFASSMVILDFTYYILTKLTSCLWVRSTPPKGLEPDAPTSSSDTARDFATMLLVCALLGMGWVSAVVQPPFVCSSLGDLNTLFQVFILLATLFMCLMYIPTRGGFILASLWCSIFTFFVITAVGPPLPPGKSHPYWEPGATYPQFEYPITGLVYGNFTASSMVFVGLVRYGWNWFVVLAGALLIAYPHVTTFKSLFVHAWYRHRLSRSFYPKPRLSFANLHDIMKITKGRQALIVAFFWLVSWVDLIIHDLLRIPFSFAAFEAFPYDHTRFSHLRACKSAPIFTSQMASQLWDVRFKDKEGDREEPEETFTDRATQHAIFAFSSKEGDMLMRGPLMSRLRRATDSADAEVITACAVSGAAVGANPGSLTTKSWPSSFLAILGGCCSRWVRLTKPDGLDLFWYLLTSLTFSAVGGVMLAGGLQCEPVQYTGSWNASTDPCGNESMVFGSAVAAFAIVNGVVVLVLAFPFFGWFLYTTGAISTGFVSGLFSVLGVTFYARTRCCAWRAKAHPRPPSGAVLEIQTQPPSVEAEEAFIPRRVLAADGGFVENMGLLPVLMEAFQGAREPLGSWSPHHIICFDGSELAPKTETLVLLHAVRLAAELLKLEAVFDPSVTAQDIVKFFGNDALRHLPAPDRALWAKLCSQVGARDDLILSAVNRSPNWWKEDMEREATCWVRILPIIFKPISMADNRRVMVWYTRPAHPQKWIKEQGSSVEYTVEANKDLFWPTWRWASSSRLEEDLASRPFADTATTEDIAAAAARVVSEFKKMDPRQEQALDVMLRVPHQAPAPVEATTAMMGAIMAQPLRLNELALELTHAALKLWDFDADDWPTRMTWTRSTLLKCRDELHRARNMPSHDRGARVLALVKALAEVHQANLVLSSEEGVDLAHPPSVVALKATRAAQAMCSAATSYATGGATAPEDSLKHLKGALNRLAKLDAYRGRTPLDTTILRTMATTMLFGVLSGILGLLEDFVFSTFLMMCSFSVRIDPYSMACLGFALAVFSLVLLMMADVRVGAERRTLKEQFIGAVLISAFPILQCALSVQMSFLPSDSLPWNAFYAPLWTIVGAGVGFIIGSFGLYFLAGNFPNHSTAVVQPVSDAQVFDAYKEAGERVALHCLTRIFNGGFHGDQSRDTRAVTFS